jgi:carotenoid cleavage dioxygenase-like enzyme
MAGMSSLSIACGQVTGAAGKRERFQSSGVPQKASSDAGLVPGKAVVEEVVLADTGPVLANRVPISLAQASGAELDLQLQVLSGSYPSDLVGHAFINSALPQGDGSPLFNGEGLFLRIDFQGTAAHLKSRLARTPCHYADRASRGTQSGFENRHLTRMSAKLGTRNFANTAFLPLQERLLVTYDGGRPYEIDPLDLKIVTGVGRTDEWMGALPSLVANLGFGAGPFPTVLSTAHPGVDPESGEVFFINYGFSMPLMPGKTVLHRWDGHGPFQSWTLQQSDGADVQIRQSVHQMAVTKNHVLLMDTAFVTEMSKMTGFGEDVVPNAPETTVWVVRRADLVPENENVAAEKLVLPLDAAHFHADHDDEDGVFVLYVAHNCTGDPSEFLEAGDETVMGEPIRQDLRGVLTAPSDIGALGRYVVEVSSLQITHSEILRDDPFMWGGAALSTHHPDARQHDSMFWLSLGLHKELAVQRVFDAYADWPGRHLPVGEIPYEEGRPGSVFKVSTGPLRVADGYTFPPGRIASSPVFLPKTDDTSANAPGYIMVTMLSDDSSLPGSTGDEFWIFDAQNLAQGPLCRLGHPELNLPFTLHTVWRPTIAPRQATYRIDVRSELQAEVAKLDPVLQQMFETDVYPHFA